MNRAPVVLVMIAALGPGLRLAAQIQPLRVQAAVESREVYVGQSFLFQLQVEGSDEPKQPDLSGLQGSFSVEPAGGGAQNSQSINIVNGRVTRTVRRGYTFNYHLAPKRSGVLEIPSIVVEAEGRSSRSQPLRINAQAPAEIRDFKLRMNLSESRVYVGQPVVVETIWYVGRNVDNFSFTMPILDDARFESADPRARINPKRQADYLEIELAGSRIVARKGRGTLDGGEFVTVKFSKVIVAREPGRYALPASAVSFRALKGQSRRSMFGDFFGDSMFGRQVYENLAIPSNRPSLTVLDLPAEGRPSDFSGLVGSFEMTASAAPLDVRVGDPVTLEIRISGPAYLDYVKLPPLERQPRLTAAFKIPEEMAVGAVQGREKVFTQTIRARRPDVEAIPAIELSYFDPEAGRYTRIETDPIPLTVKATRMVTSADLEGLGSAEDLRSELESSEQGIAHNYEDVGALEEEAYGLGGQLRSPVWAAALAGPAVVYFGLFAWRSWTKRSGGDGRAAKARRALGRVRAASRNGAPIDADHVLARFREYLGARLDKPSAALTSADVVRMLRAKGVSEALLNEIGDVFGGAEASRYAGVETDARKLAGQALAACERVEDALS